MTFPVITTLTRINGSAYEDKGVLKSTATALGEIKISALVPDSEQLATVKQQAMAFLATLPTMVERS